MDEKDTLNKKIEEMEGQLESLQTEQTHHYLNEIELENLKSELKCKLSQNEEMEQEQLKLKEQNDMLTDRLKEAEQCFVDLQNKLIHMNEVERDKSQLEKDLKEENMSLKDDKELLGERFVELEQSYAKLKQIYDDRLKSDAQDNDASSDNNKFSAEINSLKEEKVQLSEKLMALEQSYNDLKESYDNKEEQVVTGTFMESMSNQDHSNLMEENTILQQQNNKLSETIKELESKLNEMKQNTLDENIDNQKDMTLEDENKTLREEKEGLGQQIKELEQKYQELKLINEEKMKHMQDSFTENVQMEAQLKEENRDLHEQFQHIVEVMKQEHATEIKNIKKEFQSNKKNKTVSFQEPPSETFNDDSPKLTVSFQEPPSETFNGDSPEVFLQNNELKSRCEDLSAELESFSLLNTQLQNKLDEQSSKTDCVNCSQRLETIDTSQNSALELEKMNAETECKASQYESIERENVTLKEEKDLLSEQLVGLEQTYTELKQEYDNKVSCEMDKPTECLDIPKLDQQTDEHAQLLKENACLTDGNNCLKER